MGDDAALGEHALRQLLDQHLVVYRRVIGCPAPDLDRTGRIAHALAPVRRGLPRLINQIAHYALTAAALNNARTVTAEHLEHAVAELRL